MNKLYEVTQDEYSISTNPAKIDVVMVHQYLSEESYWAKNIPLTVVQKSIDHSLCFGLFHQNKQIGFARLITDRATFAYLADVFIIEAYRGKGLSKWLMQTIHAHPELQGLRRWLLGTRDAHQLYAQVGWSTITEEQYKRFMQLHNAAIYQ